MTNEEIARRLREHASQLSLNGGNLYRARAFRQAAMAVLGLDQPAAELDRDRLREVPGIGSSLADTICEYARHGQWVARPAPSRRPRSPHQLTAFGMS